MNDTMEQIAAMGQVRDAAHAAHELVELWPLTQAEQMDNDAKYGEDLQVRLTRVLATIATGTDVRANDAEYVYEGADEIPGCAQHVVDALLAANDAYDTIDEYSETHDPETIVEAATLLHAGWNDNTQRTIREQANEFETTVEQHITDDGHYLLDIDDTALARRFAFAILTFDLMMRTVAVQLGDLAPADSPTTTEVSQGQIGGASATEVSSLERTTMPLILVFNELCERLALPRIAATARQLHGLIGAYATPNGDPSEGDNGLVLAQILAPLALAEWRKHREDVLWDAAEAKQRAKEEDEKKNKEALAAKFSHVKDDPNKETVEL